MKRAYVRPTMVGERFVANEYVAACWKINCNVPWGYGYMDKNGNGYFDSSDELLTPKYIFGKPKDVKGCGIWHTGVEGVPGDGPKSNAMWHPSLSVGKDYSVYYWRDSNGEYDIHFSKVQDAQWETNPNAS